MKVRRGRLRHARRLVGLAALSVGLLIGGIAAADGRAELEKARASFLARNYVDAEERLRVLLDPKNGLKERSLVSQARMYLGASLLAQQKGDTARELFEKLVLDDPSFEPDPLGFPSDAINTFIDVRSSLLEQIKNAQQTAARLASERRAREEADREAQRAWLEKVKAQAAEEKITVRHNRVVASLPFGAGQFQNGQRLIGWIFLGAEVAAIGGTAVTYGMYRYARGRENDELRRPGGDVNQLAPQYHQQAEDLRVANLAFVGGFVAIAAIGIAQAHVAYVPESPERKTRDLPPLGASKTNVAAARAPGTSGTVEARPRASRDGVLPLSSIVPIVSPLPGRDGVVLGGVFLGLRGVTF